MLILGIDSATPAASAALADEKGLLGETLLNVGLTHSEQLLPMIDDLIRQCRRTIRDVTAIGISAGPGSFTGLRIGMATAKALAQGLSPASLALRGSGVALVAVPTLEAMAWQLAGQPVLVSAMLNARRGQIYAGLYRWTPPEGDSLPPPPVQRGKKERLPAGADRGWRLERLIPPEAVSPSVWAGRLRGRGRGVYMLGDGAAMYEDIWRRELEGEAVILPPVLGLCRGGFVALAAIKTLEENGAPGTEDFYRMKPVYLRGI